MQFFAHGFFEHVRGGADKELAVKLSAILGPLTYGAVSWASGGNHRLAMLVTGVFFIVGLALLFGVDVKRGRKMALEAA